MGIIAGARPLRSAAPIKKGEHWAVERWAVDLLEVFPYRAGWNFQEVCRSILAQPDPASSATEAITFCLLGQGVLLPSNILDGLLGLFPRPGAPWPFSPGAARVERG